MLTSLTHAGARQGPSRVRVPTRQGLGSSLARPSVRHGARDLGRLHTKRRTLACTLQRWTALRMLVRPARKRMDPNAAGRGEDWIAVNHLHGQPRTPRRRRQPSTSMAARAMTFAWSAGRRFVRGSSRKGISGASTRGDSVELRSGDVQVRGSVAGHLLSHYTCSLHWDVALKASPPTTERPQNKSTVSICVRHMLRSQAHGQYVSMSQGASFPSSKTTSSLLAPGSAACRECSGGHRRPAVPAFQVDVSQGCP